ncbi:MAG: ribose-phosphate diphosphokinase [Anaerolineaceae bacterium]|nr:ribose-phosphate diphosphokinase [Anaerolineaceae bacterium]
MAEHQLDIFSGSCFPDLAIEIASVLSLTVGKSTTTFLPDSEIHVMIDNVVRGHDIFFIQSMTRPVNEAIMELLLYIDAFRRASANKINVMIPYFPYARQERMSKGRESISARVIADLIEKMGATRISFIDIHSPAIQGFFTIPVDPISAVPTLCNHLKKFDLSDSVIVSPDVGRASLAGKYAERLNLPLTIMHKRRESINEVKTTHVIGDISNRRPIVIDDMIASGSIVSQIENLYKLGATEKTWLVITHPILLPKAIQSIINDERIEKVIVTNTLPLPSIAKQCNKIEQISIAPLLAEIIKRIHLDESISNQLVLS